MPSIARVALVTMAALVPVLAACAGTGPGPAQMALDRAESLAEAHAEDETFTLRLNPAACDCPEFEVQLDDGWHRVFLEPKDPDGPAEAVRAILAGTPGRNPAPTVRATGRLSKSVRVAGNKAPCLVLKVFLPCGRDGCRPGE